MRFTCSWLIIDKRGAILRIIEILRERTFSPLNRYVPIKICRDHVFTMRGRKKDSGVAHAHLRWCHEIRHTTQSYNMSNCTHFRRQWERWSRRPNEQWWNNDTRTDTERETYKSAQWFLWRMFSPDTNSLGVKVNLRERQCLETRDPMVSYIELQQE